MSSLKMLLGDLIFSKSLTDEGSKVYQAFLQMEGAAFSDGALKKKVKELIAQKPKAKIPKIQIHSTHFSWEMEGAVFKFSSGDLLEGKIFVNGKAISLPRTQNLSEFLLKFRQNLENGLNKKTTSSFCRDSTISS